MVVIISSVVLVAMVSFIVWFTNNYILYKRKVNKMMKNVEKYGGDYPFFGHALYFASIKVENSVDAFKFIKEMTNGVFNDKWFWIMNIPFVIVSQPDSMEKILNNPAASDKSYLYFTVFVDGIIAASREKWKKFRKRLNPTFNQKLFPNYIEEMNYQSKIFISLIRNRVNDKNTEYFNVHPNVLRYFLDVISTTHFGVNSHTQMKSSITVIERMARAMDQYGMLRLSNPLLHPDFIFKWSALSRKINDYMKPCIIYYERFLKMSMEYQQKINSFGNPLGWKSYAIHCKDILEELGITTNSDNIAMAYSDVLGAGSDTSAVVASHLIYLLGLHPEYQEIAYREIMEVLNDDGGVDNSVLTGKIDEPGIGENIKKRKTVKTENNLLDEHIDRSRNGNDSMSESENDNDGLEWTFSKMEFEGNITWTKSKLDSLKHLEQMVKESLRLCSIPWIGRSVSEDFDMGDYSMPKGAQVLISSLSVHRNPAYWEKPDSFYPEHFDPENVKQRPKYAFIGFSYGPRDCPGQVYGMYGMKCLMAEIIKNFRIETKPPTTPITYKAVFMTEHRDGYPIKFIPRE